MVTELLLGEIFGGTLRAGQRLVGKELSQRYGVSSTPIRHALVQLEAIGIVESVPNCGAVVRRITSTDVKEMFQVMRALECEATRSACGGIYLSKLHDLVDGLRRMKAAKRHGPAFVEKARQLDSRLHDLIAESCGNRLLAKEIGRLELLFRALRDAAWQQGLANDHSHRFSQEADEHLAIVEALIEGDARQASRAMTRHIRARMKYWSRGFPD